MLHVSKWKFNPNANVYCALGTFICAKHSYSFAKFSLFIKEFFATEQPTRTLCFAPEPDPNQNISGRVKLRSRFKMLIPEVSLWYSHSSKVCNLLWTFVRIRSVRRRWMPLDCALQVERGYCRYGNTVNNIFAFFSAIFRALSRMNGQNSWDDRCNSIKVCLICAMLSAILRIKILSHTFTAKALFPADRH